MEQNNCGGKNYQIQAKNIGHVGDNIYQSSLPSGAELLKKGCDLLKRRAYVEAAKILQDAIMTDPLLSDAFYYLAIALLGGRKPREVDNWTIQDIEEKLNSAILGDTKTPKYYVLLAIIKYGYYSMNGFIDRHPTSAQLFDQGEPIDAEFAKEILYHLNDPKNPYWVQLQSKFSKFN